ncbi:MAG: glycosyltransferase family 2 protein [Pseudolabrys sp.]|nr:glycosyltransferase family 2 protein [Pseudolabrys sp.]
MIPKSGDRFSDEIMRQQNAMTPRLDIVIPVYNEGNIILATLAELRRLVRTPSRILICYDRPDDDTLSAIKAHPERVEGLSIEFVLNSSRGAQGAVMSGFAASHAPFVLVFPADDDFNAGMIDAMVAKAEQGADIVCASRFIPGGSMVGCRWLKATLVRTAAFTLYYVARLPTRDATNGFRLFSRRVIDSIEIESDIGFCYSLEMLVKCHRLGWPIADVPAKWIERKQGTSRFQVLNWVPAYLRWYLYAFATTFLRLPATSVKQRSAWKAAK